FFVTHIDECADRLLWKIYISAFAKRNNTIFRNLSCEHRHDGMVPLPYVDRHEIILFRLEAFVLKRLDEIVNRRPAEFLSDDLVIRDIFNRMECSDITVDGNP